jgi:hypothetical protein
MESCRRNAIRSLLSVGAAPQPSQDERPRGLQADGERAHRRQEMCIGGGWPRKKTAQSSLMWTCWCSRACTLYMESLCEGKMGLCSSESQQSGTLAAQLLGFLDARGMRATGNVFESKQRDRGPKNVLPLVMREGKQQLLQCGNVAPSSHAVEMYSSARWPKRGKAAVCRHEASFPKQARTRVFGLMRRAREAAAVVVAAAAAVAQAMKERRATDKRD